MLTPEALREAAGLLARAELGRVPVAPLAERCPGIDVEDAYRIQLLNIDARIAAGARVVGHKVGLSSPVMQRMMGVHEPDYGHLLDDMALDPSTPVDLSRYCAPRVEVEVGFVLGDDLPGADCTVADVLAATERVVPALELIDSRIADWRIGIADTIADNASSAGFATGDGVDPRELDLTAIDAVLHRDGLPVADGRSDAVLGDPAVAVAWLARTVARFDVPLKKGHLVLPGSCTRAVDVVAGSTYTAEFRGLGSVSLSFQ
ncbi:MULTISPECIES: 2-keto-4-pentenoate hydratase [Streptomyces]|uniref:2-keto-4-pentenoate hydratase n=1 Tax=Streptomyces solicathayae TaxID=3081768 RepID=A0ABZ0LZV8_9ACTN|nr:2-keto-4-pentenoate hydratase [Streptomyces sp. HUAS YS2]WOX24979.1 2-keto-4-pentenoate hydratase [Streptomyces sp. HUAS YS2]